MDYTSFCDGLPVSYKIRSIWFNVDVPGNNDLPVISSPRMQPTDHISTAFEYLVEPRSISGARYHLVATYSVKTGSTPFYFGQLIDLASPKSATFIWH